MKGKSITRAIEGAQKKRKCRSDALAASSHALASSHLPLAVEKFVEKYPKLSADNVCARATWLSSVAWMPQKDIKFQMLS